MASKVVGDPQVGDSVQGIVPFAGSVRMPNHPRSPIVMICTGSAPLRAERPYVGPLIRDPNACFDVCGLKSMEEGVRLALLDIATGAGLDWEGVGASPGSPGRLHREGC